MRTTTAGYSLLGGPSPAADRAEQPRALQPPLTLRLAPGLARRRRPRYPLRLRMLACALLAMWIALIAPADARTIDQWRDDVPAGEDAGSLRCLALIALAEAGSEGEIGMTGVMRVVLNRIADGRFSTGACAVALQPRQFQPVAEQPWLRDELQRLEQMRPDDPALIGAATRPAGPFGAARVAAAYSLARAVISRYGEDPTLGALYFVNPSLIDDRHCRWFATLAATASIGRHLFMTDRPDQASAPALDCAAPTPERRLASTWLPSATTTTPRGYASRSFEPRPVAMLQNAVSTAEPAVARPKIIRLVEMRNAPAIFVRQMHKTP